jgi:hypothetical protein
VNEFRSVDLARSHRDDLLCVETVFIVQEAHVQLVERLAKVRSHNHLGLPADLCCRACVYLITKYYGSSLIHHVYEARHQFRRTVHSHQTCMPKFDKLDDDDASSACGRSCGYAWWRTALETHMHVPPLGNITHVEGHQAVGWTVPSNIGLDMHQGPVLEEGAVAL